MGLNRGMKTLLMILALGLCLPLAGADKDKPLPKDFKSLKALAEKGDARAQNNLGVRYEKGQGVEQDFKEAFKWYQKSADQGQATAQFNLGMSYASGQGVEKDSKEAVKWFQKAADQGNARAQYVLGFMYAEGRVLMEDNVTAYAWYNIAAVNGLANGKEAKDSTAKKMTADQIAKAEALVKEMIAKNPKLIKKP